MQTLIREIFPRKNKSSIRIFLIFASINRNCEETTLYLVAEQGEDYDSNSQNATMGTYLTNHPL